MNKNIIDQNTEVNFGDGMNVSMQTVQHIYNKITGKKERLQKTFHVDHQINIDDILQINKQILQTLEQYNVKSRNESVELFFLDDNTETYSSFDRFKIINVNESKALENIRLQYNFLITLPQNREPQTYTIELNLLSRAAIVEKSKRDLDPIRFFSSVMGDVSGNLQIRFVDYVVAKNFERIIDDWFSALQHRPRSKLMSLIRRYSSFVEPIIRISSIILFSFLFYQSFISSIVIKAVSDLSPLIPLVIYAMISFRVIDIIASRIADICEQSIDQLTPTSALNITAGDRKIIAAANKKWRNSIFGIIFSLIFNVVCNVLAAYSGHFIGIGP